MDPTTFPTKGNLLLARKTLRLSQTGYELLDKKRNVLMRELMDLNAKAKELQESIDHVFSEAYKALQNANVEMGITQVQRISFGVPAEESIVIRTRSVMGVEIPIVTSDGSDVVKPDYGFGGTTIAIDRAVYHFLKVKNLILLLSMVENAAYRLALSIRKTQKRANALKNVTIPKYESLVHEIVETLEERERDEFTRLKVIKKRRG